MQFAGRVIVEKTLAALDAGFRVDCPLCVFVFHNRGNDALGGVIFNLLLIFRIFLSFLRQKPVYIPKICFVGIGIGVTTGINVTRGIAACGFIALMIPNVRLQSHKQAAGDVALVVRDIGHHPFDVFSGDGIHFAKTRIRNSRIPQSVTVCSSGAFVGVRVQKTGCSKSVRIAEIHAVELFACCRGRAIGVLLSSGGQAGRPEVGVRCRLNACSTAGSCQCRSGQQCQQGQQRQKRRQKSRPDFFQREFLLI